MQNVLQFIECELRDIASAKDRRGLGTVYGYRNIYTHKGNLALFHVMSTSLSLGMALVNHLSDHVVYVGELRYSWFSIRTGVRRRLLIP